MEEQEGYIDAETYKGGFKDGLTFKEIVMLHLKQIISFECVEMRGGFWVTKSKISHGIITETKEYEPDTREVFSNAVNGLYDLLLPLFDKPMSEKAKELNLRLETIRKDCIKETSNKDEEILPVEFYNGKDRLLVEQYRYKKLRLMREMFQELSLFLNRISYLSGYGDNSIEEII